MTTPRRELASLLRRAAGRLAADPPPLSGPDWTNIQHQLEAATGQLDAALAVMRSRSPTPASHDVSAQLDLLAEATLDLRQQIQALHERAARAAGQA